MNEDSLTDEEPLQSSQEFSWLKDIAVDRTLLTPKASTKKLTIMMPKYEKKVVAVLIRHPDTGELFYTPEGHPYYNLQEEIIFVGYEPKEIDLPGAEIFNIDLTSSYLSEFDVPAIRLLISIYSDLQLQTLKGKSRLADLYYVYSRIMGMVNTAKARDGKIARLAKTTITEGTSKQQIIDEFRKDEERKGWFSRK